MSEIKFTEEGFDRFYNYRRNTSIYRFLQYNRHNQLHTPETVKETFFTNMNQILKIWLKVWSSLNNYEKNIIKQLTDESSMTWSDLVEKTNMSKGTLNKYLTNLKYKGLLS